MANRGWLTPNNGTTEYICRPILVPIDDQLYFLAAVNGALVELTREWNWEQYGDMTPAEAAEVMQVLYDQYTSVECTEGGPCVIPPNIILGITFPTRVVRRGVGGYTEELVGGVWQEPTGDYEVPPIPAREEPTPEDNRCLASINAVTVLEQLYEDATDAYAEFSTLQSIVDAVLGGVALALGLFGQVTAAAYMSLGQNALDTFFEVFGIIAEDVWTTPFTRELACIFYDNSSDDGGVVTFDFDGINSDLFALQTNALDDLDRALLISQVGYFLSILAAGGINIAGSTTAVTSYDCDTCNEWCYEFDFQDSTGDWVATPTRAAQWISPGPPTGTGWYSVPTTGPFAYWLAIEKQFSARTITEIVLEYRTGLTANNGAGANGYRFLDLFNGPVGTGLEVGHYALTLTATGTTFITLTVNPDVVADRIRIWLDTNNASSGGFNTIRKITIRGLGFNPFGDSNCEV